jgi:hypothetical protein
MVDEWEGARSRLSICVFGVVIFSRHQKGGRNGFLAGSPDCHSSSDRNHGRCIRDLSRLFVNGANLPVLEDYLLPDASLCRSS